MAHNAMFVAPGQTMCIVPLVIPLGIIGAMYPILFLCLPVMHSILHVIPGNNQPGEGIVEIE